MVVLSVLCAVKMVKLNELEVRKSYLAMSKTSIEDFAQEIQNFSFPCLKTKEKLFPSNKDLKKNLETISKKLSINNVLIKFNVPMDSVEIKIQTNQESKIYKFIEELFFELPGIVQFKSIKIFPMNKKNLAALIQFKIFFPEKCSGLLDINPIPRNSSFASIRLLEKVKAHKLFCTIYNLRAYIDNSWFQIGDDIDDFRLIAVKQNSIEIEDQTGHKVQVKLGTTW